MLKHHVSLKSGRGNVTWSFHQGVLTQLQTLLESMSKVFKQSERRNCVSLCVELVSTRGSDGFAYDLILV
jgi:hypothetical protein